MLSSSNSRGFGIKLYPHTVNLAIMLLSTLVSAYPANNRLFYIGLLRLEFGEVAMKIGLV